MKDRRWKTEDGRWKMEDGRWSMRDTGGKHPWALAADGCGSSCVGSPVRRIPLTIPSALEVHTPIRMCQRNSGGMVRDQDRCDQQEAQELYIVRKYAQTCDIDKILIYYIIVTILNKESGRSRFIDPSENEVQQ